MKPQHRDAIEYIRKFRHLLGGSPSFEDIRVGLNLSSKSQVFRLIDSLEVAGHLRRLPGKSRSIELIPQSPVLSIELPPHLYSRVVAVARETKVTPEAVVIEAVRSGFASLPGQSGLLRSSAVPPKVSRDASPRTVQAPPLVTP